MKKLIFKLSSRNLVNSLMIFVQLHLQSFKMKKKILIECIIVRKNWKRRKWTIDAFQEQLDQFVFFRLEDEVIHKYYGIKQKKRFHSWDLVSNKIKLM